MSAIRDVRDVADQTGAGLTSAARIRSAVIWRSGSQIAGQLVMWSSTFLVLRLLTPADYGLFAMTQVVIAFVQILNGFGFASSLVQAESVDRERVRQIFGVLIVLNLAIAAAQFAAAPAAAAYFHQPRLVGILRVQCLIHLTTPFIIMPQALLARGIDFRTQGRANFLSAVVGAIVGPACAFAGFGVWTLVIAPIALFATKALMLGALGRWWVWPRFGLAGAGALLGYGGTVLIGEVLWFLQNQVDVFIAGRRLDAHLLGLYSEGLFLTQILVNKFVPALNDVAFPTYARMQADRGAVARGFAGAAGVIMLAAMPFYAGLAATAGPLVTTVMGDQWRDAAPIVRLLAIAMPFVTLHILYPAATNALGRPAVSVKSTGVGAVLLTIAFLTGVRHGAIGMAAAWLAAMPLLLIVSSTLSLPVIGLAWRDLARAVLPPVLAATAMGLAVAAIDRALPASLAPALRLALLVPVGVLLYALLALLLARPLLVGALGMIRGRTAAPAI